MIPDPTVPTRPFPQSYIDTIGANLRSQIANQPLSQPRSFYPDARETVMRQLTGNPLSGIGSAVGGGVNWLLHGGGTRQENQVGQLHMMLLRAGLHPLEAQRIAEGLVYHPYLRNT